MRINAILRIAVVCMVIAACMSADATAQDYYNCDMDICWPQCIAWGIDNFCEPECFDLLCLYAAQQYYMGYEEFCAVNPEGCQAYFGTCMTNCISLVLPPICFEECTDWQCANCGYFC